MSWPDTGSYFDAARDLLRGTLLNSQGRRTPGYPVLIVLGNFEPHSIVWLQSLGGLLSSSLLFFIANSLTRAPRFAFLIGMTFNLNLQQIFIEHALLSESICTFWLLLVVTMMIVVLERIRAERPGGLVALLAGIAAGIVILVRPQFVFLILLLPLVSAFAIGKAWFRTLLWWRDSALMVMPMFIMLFAWSTAVYSATGYFTLSTQSGFSVINHSIAFVEFAPDRYATLRQILLKHRETKLKEQGHYGNTGWLALPDIRRATGMSLPEVSREFQMMSAELFLAHPGLYLRSVVLSWVDFWTVPLVWQPQLLHSAVVSPTEAVWWVEHKLLRVANACFLLLVFAVLLSKRARLISGWRIETTAIAAIILFSSVVQALADYGASSRYAITVQALVVLVVFTTAVRIREGGTNLARRTSARPVPDLRRRPWSREKRVRL